MAVQYVECGALSDPGAGVTRMLCAMTPGTLWLPESQISEVVAARGSDFLAGDNTDAAVGHDSDPVAGGSPGAVTCGDTDNVAGEDSDVMIGMTPSRMQGPAMDRGP